MAPFLRRILMTIALVLAAVTASAASKPYAGEYPYRAVCTVGMVADIVESVAGEKARIETLIPAGVDPHTYSPTRDDLAALMGGDVIFYSGLLLEGRMQDIFIKAGRSRPVYAVTERMPEEDLLALPDASGHHDPHVWMDPARWAIAAKAVGEALAEFDPPNAAMYRANAESYAAHLKELDAYARQVLASIPADRRLLVTAHDAFNYLGVAYDVEVRGIQGISTESEAGLQDINRLVDLLVTRKVPAVFIESTVSDKNVRALIEGAEARGQKVVVGAQLFSDAMGPAGTYEGTYVGMIDHNVTSIARALGGTAPEGGWQGKLKPSH